MKNKKIVAIIPIKTNSKRVKNKNFKKINNIPLYEFLLKKIKSCNFDEIYVDSDSNKIKSYCKKNNINFIKRLSKLATDNANGNDLLNYHAKLINADIYFQLFITAPLLKISTINKCIETLKKNKKIDSILTAQKIYSWFWFNNKSVNYNPKILPRSQDAKPLIQETTGLYGIKKKALKKNKCRIGKKPFFHFIDKDEAIDLDNKEDFDYLKYYVNKN
jgi:CMP-N-acetylneuraminic acid synthetase